MTADLTPVSVVYGNTPGSEANATLHTTVNPRNLSTSITCDYGLTASYGTHNTLDVSLTGTTPIAIASSSAISAVP